MTKVLSEGEKNRAKELGFTDLEYLLACLNAEVNGIDNPDLRDSKRIDTFVANARRYIGRILQAQATQAQEIFEEIERVDKEAAVTDPIPLMSYVSAEEITSDDKAYLIIPWGLWQSLKDKLTKKKDDIPERITRR